MFSQQANGVAAEGSLPGTVLDPNADFIPITDDSLPANQFGDVAPKPNAASSEPDPAVTDADTRRFQYHQSRADKAEAELKKAQQMLQAVQPVLPLITAMRNDKALLSIVENHISGGAAPKPLEAPKRPDAYNEVEAYSNPESASFKYRKELEAYQQTYTTRLEQRLNEIENRRRQESQELEAQLRQREENMRFQQELIAAGAQTDELPEIFQLVNNATPKDMVEFVQFRKAKAAGRPTVSPLPRGMGNNRAGGAPKNPWDDPNYDFGKDITRLAQTLR